MEKEEEANFRIVKRSIDLTSRLSSSSSPFIVSGRIRNPAAAIYNLWVLQQVNGYFYSFVQDLNPINFTFIVTVLILIRSTANKLHNSLIIF